MPSPVEPEDCRVVRPSGCDRRSRRRVQTGWRYWPFSMHNDCRAAHLRETDCVAGVGGLELRNGVANYPFETPREFAPSALNFGHGLSCSAGPTQLGLGSAGTSASAAARTLAIVSASPSKARIGRDLFRSEDDRPASSTATPLLSLRWTLRAKRACVLITDAEPARRALLTPPAPMGLRGVWVVAARCCASPPARCCAELWLTIRRHTKCHSIGRYSERGPQQCLRLRVDGIIFIARRCGGSAQSISYVRSHCARCA
jgi:hypothetical protein